MIPTPMIQTLIITSMALIIPVFLLIAAILTHRRTSRTEGTGPGDPSQKVEPPQKPLPPCLLPPYPKLPVEPLPEDIDEYERQHLEEVR